MSGFIAMVRHPAVLGSATGSGAGWHIMGLHGSRRPFCPAPVPNRAGVPYTASPRCRQRQRTAPDGTGRCRSLPPATTHSTRWHHAVSWTALAEWVNIRGLGRRGDHETGPLCSENWRPTESHHPPTPTVAGPSRTRSPVGWTSLHLKRLFALRGQSAQSEYSEIDFQRPQRPSTTRGACPRSCALHRARLTSCHHILVRRA